MKKKKGVFLILIPIFLLLAFISFRIIKYNYYAGDKIYSIKIDSEEGNDCYRKVSELFQSRNVKILKIRKHKENLIGDGYAMGTDKKPVVLATRIFYYITVKVDDEKYLLKYIPKQESYTNERITIEKKY